MGTRYVLYQVSYCVDYEVLKDSDSRLDSYKNTRINLWNMPDRGCMEVPIVGGNVLIGTGALIIGVLVVDSNVMIGTNAVAVQNILDNTVAARGLVIVKINHLLKREEL